MAVQHSETDTCEMIGVMRVGVYSKEAAEFTGYAQHLGRGIEAGEPRVYLNGDIRDIRGMENGTALGIFGVAGVDDLVSP